MATRKAAVEGENLLITQVKSGIGTKPIHRATLRALGLRGIGQHNVLPDRPEIRGMLHKVPHLVSVEVAGADVVAKPARVARRNQQKTGES